MNENLKVNRHPVLSDKIIHSSIKSINKRYNTRIESEQFFDHVMSNFCVAELKNNVLALTFPVVATSEYANVELPVFNDSINIKGIKYNKAFEKEIKRIKENFQ